MVSPLVPWGWRNSSAWLFLSHLQKCVSCHFGSAKQSWMSAQTKALDVGTVKVLMRWTSGSGGESSQLQRGWALVRHSLCLCLSLSSPALLFCWASVELTPSSQSRRYLLSSRLSDEMRPPAAVLLDAEGAVPQQALIQQCPQLCSHLQISLASSSAPWFLPATADLCLMQLST